MRREARASGRGDKTGHEQRLGVQEERHSQHRRRQGPEASQGGGRPSSRGRNSDSRVPTGLS